MDSLDRIGIDATTTPSVMDWKAYYTKYIVPTYHFQPNLSMQIVPSPIPVSIDDKEVAEVYTIDDIEDAIYEFETMHNDVKPQGTPKTVYLPVLQESALFSDREMNLPFAQRRRMNLFTLQAVQKIKDKADRVFFQGDSTKNVVGAIGTDSTDLGAPTGVWDVDTGSNGTLDNALADFNKIVNHFEDNGLGGRSITVCLTNECAQLLRSTQKLYSDTNNLDMALKILPPGSRILNSNNIQTTAPAGGAADNYMVAFVDLMSNGEGFSDEGGYEAYSSGVVQKVHHVDVDKWRYWLGMRYSIKVRDDAYVCWMDAIDCST